MHNKPFSWELRGAIYSTLPADPIALANAEPLASVRFNLAVKVSERAMVCPNTARHTGGAALLIHRGAAAS